MGPVSSRSLAIILFPLISCFKHAIDAKGQSVRDTLVKEFCEPLHCHKGFLEGRVSRGSSGGPFIGSLLRLVLIVCIVLFILVYGESILPSLSLWTLI